MKNYIVANFKANLTEKEVKKWVKEFQSFRLLTRQDLELVVCPAINHLDEFAALVATHKLKLGVQDLSKQPQGPFTGEVTAETLKKEGVDYAILGHSERRKLFKETNKKVLAKVKQALKSKIIPIVCVDKNTFAPQIKLIKQKLSSQNPQLIYAYEPTLAIGTGKPENPKIAEKICLEIEKQSHCPVLYGGSVNHKNALSFLKQPHINGLLIATASLKAKNFLKIIKNIHE